MLLARRSTGQVVVKDLYILLSAENLSDVLKRGWLPIAKQLSKSTAEKFLTTTEPLVANLEQVQKMIELAAQQKHVEAVAVYDALPETVRRDKTLLMLRLRSAQAVSEEEYSKAIQDFRKYHPNDVALDFVLIDGYTLLKQYDEALQCVIRVNDSIGGDAGLLVKKSGALLLLNKVPEARKALEEAIIREPDYYDAYAQGLDVALADDNSDETVKYLTILETKFKMTFNNLREVEPFAKFVKSEQYRKWAEGRKDQEQK
jgi:tetratricopeptide (TPR) repeat protein